MINEVSLLGRVGVVPEIKSYNNNLDVSKFSLVTWDIVKDEKEDSGFKQLNEWHNITVFGSLVEYKVKKLNKGDLIFISGKIKTSEYEKDGIKRYSTEIIASQIKIVSRRIDDPFEKEDQKEKKEINDDLPF